MMVLISLSCAYALIACQALFFARRQLVYSHLSLTRIFNGVTLVASLL